ncbi:MAG: hypothetical protein AAB855_00990, partial [Patescibacteria group bacterium]
QCKKLMFKGIVIEGVVEIKCRSCHTINTVSASEMKEYLCAIKNCPGRIRLEPQTTNQDSSREDNTVYQTASF